VQALDGLTVLDCATFVAAPFCCTLLGEFGASVIKVEQPGIGDDLRRQYTSVVERHETSVSGDELTHVDLQ